MSIWIYQPDGAVVCRDGTQSPAAHGDQLEVGDSLTTYEASVTLFAATGATITLGPNTVVIVLPPTWKPDWYPYIYSMLMCAWYPDTKMRAWYPHAWYPDFQDHYLPALKLRIGTIVGCLRELDEPSYYHFELPSAVATSQNSDLALTVDRNAMKARASCSRGLVRLAFEEGGAHLVGSNKSADYKYSESKKSVDSGSCSAIPQEDLDLIEDSIWDWELLGEFIISSASACSGEIEFACDLPVGDLPNDVLPSMLGLVISEGQAMNESSVFTAFDTAKPSRATLFDRSWLEDIIRPGEDKARVYTKVRQKPDETC